MDPWTALISARLRVSKEMLFWEKKIWGLLVRAMVVIKSRNLFHGGREKHNSFEYEKSHILHGGREKHNSFECEKSQ